MALQICQFNLQYNGSFPVNRAFNFAVGNNINMFPNGKDVNIKYLAVDCIYNTTGDLCVKDYTLNIILLNNTQNIKQPNQPIIINSSGFVGRENRLFISLNKNNPFQKVNIVCGGIAFSNVNNIRSNIVLSNNTSVISGTIIFILSAYYENI